MAVRGGGGWKRLYEVSGASALQAEFWSHLHPSIEEEGATRCSDAIWRAGVRSHWRVSNYSRGPPVGLRLHVKRIGVLREEARCRWGFGIEAMLWVFPTGNLGCFQIHSTHQKQEGQVLGNPERGAQGLICSFDR